MIPIEELRDLQANFEPDHTTYKRLEQLRSRFVRLFPRSRIPHLTLDDYVLGKRSKHSFCYWVEIETMELGHIQGATSAKFGVYYNSKTSSFQFTKRFRNEADPRTRILRDIADLLEAADDGDINAVRSSAVSPMFKGKLLFLYFPKRFINIFSDRHVDHFLSQLRLNNPGSKLDLVSKKEQLTEFKANDDVMNDWSTLQFSDFLYSTWRPLKRDAKVPAPLKNFILNLPDLEAQDPDFINLQIGETPEPPKTTAPGNGERADFDQKNRRNKLIGNRGEEVVFLAEKRELTRNGRGDLALKVKEICKEDDGAGYDILSFELDGRKKLIEVKSTATKAPGPNATFEFHLSANEHKQARRLPNFYLYVVFDVTSKQPKIWPIPDPASLEPRRLLLKPSAYYATLTIARND